MRGGLYFNHTPQPERFCSCGASLTKVQISAMGRMLIRTFEQAHTGEGHQLLSRQDFMETAPQPSISLLAQTEGWG